ncbi:MAG: Response regulator receiver protein [uncultured bacterium]|uniref:DNA-binding response regulator n=1 Tax=Candidatus Daviesbacteria bacterium GW2011_GWC2_40_12 TaxID=1618431 RepID=A0A0G0T3P6_9BACT|nr:MAG: Response regulator receiver protein [uncultured bacterium]KKQ83809.1 MAG: DNA-binding response regulator [Candidatus Daviesbacteria bacterium GW2011_GWF2_38_7]KKR17482.1 MAG: DNA-binding response regulator [Candidatus Daviesbacteria bacterium GW2011_GWA2_39_33]KKR23108.1 MAG: DNA-binding response regulator [Candidatus Daviesbacteria bacterium GW2011_GWB1_39_5]KKR41725.1 MAG: DNA-binding response regulator [Candidatus Daviesbacteria bacterium GW2011_GWC2_40_12]OGE21563.1 MAG: hypothetic
MRKKILVIDDSKAILEVIQIMLEEKGYLVKILDHTEDVFREVEGFGPDLIILDVWMPALSGKDITKKLKQADSTKNIPIIIFSALTKNQASEEVKEADDYLSKPFEMEELFEKVVKNISGG